MENTVEEKNTKNTMDVLALIVSVIAMAISIISFGYTVYKDNANSMEKIKITKSSIGNEETVLYNMSGGVHGQGMLSGANYSIIISNNSKERISIVSYNIAQEVDGTKIFYGKMVEGVKDSANQKVTFPISLDAGESLLVKYEINTLIPASVNKLISARYGTQAEINYEELQEYLGEYGRDIFGNEIEYTKFEDGNYLISIAEAEFPIYDLQLVTSKGNCFEIKLSHGSTEKKG